ncbi:MAG: YraN family protein [Desulfotomaculaceae bacterium]|nr:YraN family protein [Desulfotomaculaceae bacterium]
MTIRRKLLGRQGEDAAARYLEKNNYQVLCRNYTCRLGEIDIVARERDFIVFIEVRSRSSDDYGLPQESVTNRKKMKLRQLAWHYLKAVGQTNASCRFDVIAVLFAGEGRVKKLEHIENAF